MESTRCSLSPWANRNFCDVCNTIEWPSPHGQNQRHVQDFPQLVQSALDCPLCELICSGLRQEFLAANAASPVADDDMGAVDEAIEASMVSPDNPFLPGIFGWVTLQSMGISQEGQIGRLWVFVSPKARCQLELSLPPDLFWPLFWPGRQLHRSETSLPGALILASRLVKSAEGEDLQPLPTRLLDLGSPSGRIRLVEPENGSTGRYATLSHRWGTLTGHVTTQENLAERLQELDVRNLPELFVDAIRVCLATGLRYLWIDSLCILQNSLEDWERGFKLMGNVYAHSTFTIAAHSAKTDQESFLKNSAARVKSVSLQGMDKQLWNIRLPRNFEREMACTSSINSRGWVLQERLLSKRILHFLPSAIYLETDKGVQEMDSAEGFYSNGSPKIIQHQPYDFERLQLMDAFDRANPSDHWQSIVEAYSKCHFTNDGDKLPALAGIASRIQKKNRFDYIAGLWFNEDFLSQLLWFASDGRSTRRPKSPRAPSLSWASVDGPVKHLFERKRRSYSCQGPRPGRLVPAGLNDFYNKRLFTHADLINGPNRDHLRSTLECQNKEEPYWIDEDVPLLFEGALAQLPKLGSRWSPTSPTFGNHRIWRRIAEQFKAVDGIHCCRPLLLGDDIVGIVILDEDSDDRSPETALWCLSAARGPEVVVLLVVSENHDQPGTYRRAGLCLVVQYTLPGDGCSFRGEPSFLTGLRGKKQSILFT